tara:strand:- start:278 stop:514 length:237 start_codon:yes stop_codon:yes gene_type:complete
MNSISQRLDLNPLLEYRDLKFVTTDWRPVCVYDPRKNQRPTQTTIPQAYQNLNFDSCSNNNAILEMDPISQQFTHSSQ